MFGSVDHRPLTLEEGDTYLELLARRWATVEAWHLAQIFLTAAQTTSKENTMVDFTHHSRDSIDIAELAAFTYRAYSQLPIPYKYGGTQEEITNFLSKDCPDFIVLARAADGLLGWAGVFNWTDSQAYFLSWHPLVIPPNPEIAQQLVRECIQYTISSGRQRMEVFLMNLTAEYRDYAAQCGAIYQAAGMVPGY
jgi:hypothetical protein